MALQYSNITGNSAQVLIAKRRVSNNLTSNIDLTFNALNIKNIILSNKHATDAVIVDMYIYDATLGTFYILNNVKIPNGATLMLDNSDISFNNADYELKILLSAVDSAVDVIIK